MRAEHKGPQKSKGEGKRKGAGVEAGWGQGEKELGWWAVFYIQPTPGAPGR